MMNEALPDDSPLRWVDPFLGCEPAQLPPPDGIATRWWTAKPPIGNTHPGAVRPFGMVSACAYSGAYVTGYGCYDLSLDGGPPRKLFENLEALGIAHFQQSGTGRIRMYYNYLLTTPLGPEGLAGRTERRRLENESARPGYYAGSFPEIAVDFEVAAGSRGVRHRYGFPPGVRPELAIEVSAGGLRVEGMETYPQGGYFCVTEDGEVAGHVVMEGIPLRFRCRCEGGEPFLWEDDEELAGAVDYELGLDKQKYRPRFGFGFRGRDGEPLELGFGFSLRSDERAADAVPATGLAATAGEAADAWDGILRTIEVEGGTPAQREVFMTSFYRSLVKPSDFRDENPFSAHDGPFFFDLSTLWDLYKTQLPLVMTLWPDWASDFVTFLQEIASREGGFPVSYLMDNAPDRFSKQATGLCHAILEDARIRGAKGDWDEVLAALWKTSQSGKGRKSRFGEYGRSFEVDPLSHTLDIAYAHYCMARMARSVGHQVIHDKSGALSEHWRNAFDPATGLLREDSTYYEGENWNYSFRLLHDMKARIELAGGTDRFVALLDKFFGFVEPAHGERVFRFEGLNNEPDMEAPYAYLYAGRHDRTARVVRRVMDCRYSTGRGGLAGNEDSGGLSSWYVWNAVGLFPVCGQPVMLIGSPLFDRAILHLPGGDFRITAEGNGPEAVFVSEATLNGRPLSRAWLKIEELMSGGELRLRMSEQPSEFGAREVPPSFPA